MEITGSADYKEHAQPKASSVIIQAWWENEPGTLCSALSDASYQSVYQDNVKPIISSFRLQQELCDKANVQGFLLK